MAGANVPGLDQAPQLSQNVPGAQLPNRREFGQEGQALQHVGEAIQGDARIGADIYDEVQRQHDLSTATSNYVDASVEHAKQLQNLKLTSPDGFIHDHHTGEIIQNADGSQRTIAQEYWDWADSDYQSRQKGMSPRAAAMFRSQMLPHIGDNTKVMQNDALLLQRDAADTNIKLSMHKYSVDNDRTPYPEQNPYYEDRNPDGSINLRQNVSKISDQLQTLKLWTARQGPTESGAGMYNPDEVAKNTEKRLSEHAEDWMRSAVTDLMENDTPRNHKNRVSTTAVHQVFNLLDIAEGKDPQSKQLSSKGLPTVNSSLTSEQIDKWRAKLNELVLGAQKIDKSDYELQLQSMKHATEIGQYKNFDTLMRSPEFAYLAHAAAPLGMSPEAQTKDFAEIFGNAARTAGHEGISDLADYNSKKRQIDTNLDSFEKGFPQYAAMLGVNFTGALGPAILGEAKKNAYASLEKEAKEYREDPAKFAAGMASGVSNQPRSRMMKAVEDKLFVSPELDAILKPMANGKPLIVNATREMDKIGSMGFGAGFSPPALSKDAWEAQANKIKMATDPRMVDSFFSRIKTVMGNRAPEVMDQLVKVGGLDPRWVYNQNLPTAQMRQDDAAMIYAGKQITEQAAEASGKTTKEIKETAHGLVQDRVNVLSKIYGGNSPLLAKNVDALQNAAESAYAAALKTGVSPDQARTAALEKINKGVPGIGVVGDQANWAGINWWNKGPQVPIFYSSPNLSQDQQQTINSNLLKAQRMEAIGRRTLVPAPVAQGAYDFNKKLDAKWISENPGAWGAVPTDKGYVYRLFYHGMNADGSPNGEFYPVRHYAPDGTPSFYEIPEKEALLKHEHGK